MTANGATSIWSGYSYQGRVALFVALRETNRIIAENAKLDGEAVHTLLAKWSLRCEFKEDFEIVDDSQIYSRHQVKAYHSNDQSSYDKVFKRMPRVDKKGEPKLDENGNQLYKEGFICDDVDEDKRFLHVICDLDITSWENNYKIQLYEYPGVGEEAAKKYCPLSLITSDDEDGLTLLVLNELEQLTGLQREECKLLWHSLQHIFTIRLSDAHEKKELLQFSFDELLRLNTVDSSLEAYKGHKIQREIEQYHLDYLASYDDDPDFNEDMRERLVEYVQTIIGLRPDVLLRTVRYFNVDDENFEKVEREGIKDVVYEVLSRAIDFKYDPLCVKAELNGKNYVLTTITALDEVSELHRKGKNKVTVEKVLAALSEEDVALVFSRSNIVNKQLSITFADITGDVLETAEIAGRTVYNLVEDAPVAFVSVSDTVSAFNKGKV